MQKTASTKRLLLEHWLDLQKWPRRVKKDLIAEEVKLEELDQAKGLRIKQEQRSVLADKKFDQIKASLLLFTDDEGILRCGGLLKNGPLILSELNAV